MEGVGITAKWGSAEFDDFKDLQKRLTELEKERDKFCEACAKELAARLLALVIPRTPIGKYSGGLYECDTRPSTGRVHKSSKSKAGKTGGTLRRGWTAEQSATDYVKSMSVEKSGHVFVIRITNPVKYASYVEFGHRTPNGGFAEGHYMMTISEDLLDSRAAGILEKKLEKWLKGAIGDGN